MKKIRLGLPIALAACVLTSCGEDEKRTVERVQAEKAAAEQSAARRAMSEAEARQMADPITAAQLLEGRIADWLTIKDGLIIVRGETTPWTSGTRARSHRVPWHTMPTTTPWLVTCDQRGLEITLGGWSMTSENATEPMVSAELTRTKLSDDQCKSMVRIVGEKMLVLTREK